MTTTMGSLELSFHCCLCPVFVGGLYLPSSHAYSVVPLNSVSTPVIDCQGGSRKTAAEIRRGAEGFF